MSGCIQAVLDGWVHLNVEEREAVTIAALLAAEENDWGGLEQRVEAGWQGASQPGG
jgi:hypothetical protein